MPFEIQEEEDCLVLRLYGVLTSEDLQWAGLEIARREQTGATAKNRLTDLTALEGIAIGFPEVLAAATRRNQLTFPRRVKSAMVARRPIHVGFARMFQTLIENPQIEVRVVDSVEEARRWFDSDDS